jgi:hypothetical protein
MVPIEEPRISKKDDMFVCTCPSCGFVKSFTGKGGALNLLKRGYCKDCKIDYRIIKDKERDEQLGIYLNEDNKWCSTCDSCEKEQVYNRKGHAIGSAVSKAKCRKCACYENKIRPSLYNGFRIIDTEIFEKNAITRGLCWKLDKNIVSDLFEAQNGKCALSGIELVKNPRTWSIDRIDSNKGYELGNIQLVDKRINMMKGTLSQEDFISLCVFVADKAKW